jgi:hypothetical protein
MAGLLDAECRGMNMDPQKKRALTKADLMENKAISEFDYLPVPPNAVLWDAELLLDIVYRQTQQLTEYRAMQPVSSEAAAPSAIDAVSATTDEFRVEIARLKAQREGDPCIATKAFPFEIPVHTYRRWCRDSYAAICAGRTPHFTCWKEGRDWYVDKHEAGEFLIRKRITPR